MKLHLLLRQEKALDELLRQEKALDELLKTTRMEVRDLLAQPIHVLDLICALHEIFPELKFKESELGWDRIQHWESIFGGFVIQISASFEENDTHAKIIITCSYGRMLDRIKETFGNIPNLNFIYKI